MTEFHGHHHVVAGGHHVEDHGEQNENAHHEKLENEVGILTTMRIQAGHVSGWWIRKKANAVISHEKLGDDDSGDLC